MSRVTLTAQTITSWPWPQEENRRRAPFRASWSFTEALLRDELRHLGVDVGILEIDVTERELRNDGWIRSDARPASPRVVVAFQHPEQGWLRYPCDRFLTWQDNVRAVALGLEALRKVDRYGITRRGEQYSGFKALPSTTGPTMTVTRAAELLANDTSPAAVKKLLGDADLAHRCALISVKKAHPDAGGTAEAFQSVQTARKVLSAHFGREI